MAVTPEAIRALAVDLSLGGGAMLAFEVSDDALLRAAARALTSLRAFLGWTPDVELLDEVQLAALDDAIALQTIFALEQGSEDLLGIDDRVAGAGGVTFTPRAAPRVSAAAAEALAGVGLVRRSGVSSTTV